MFVFWLEFNYNFLLDGPVDNKLALVPWWRHQMETFSALLAVCAGNSTVTGEFPSQRPVTRSFDVFFDLHLNKPLSKQSWGWWFETPSRSLWRHCNEGNNELMIIRYSAVLYGVDEWTRTTLFKGRWQIVRNVSLDMDYFYITLHTCDNN